MATPAEKLAHVEEALRRRFFPLVPQRQQNWPEAQHDVDRHSRSLAAYAVCGLCGAEDAIGVGALVDGGDDGGIDALLYDRIEGRLIVVQSKFKRPRNPENPQGTAPDQGDVLKFTNGVKALLQRRFDGFNVGIRDRLDEIEEALETPGVKICLVLAFLGEALDRHANDDLNALLAETNKLGEWMSLEVVGLSKTYDWLVAEQTPGTIDIQVALENWASITAPRRAIYGQMSASELARLVEAHGHALFERNIRHYLGSVGVNAAIEETVRRRPGDFFYLNNGLTAVAEQITQAPGNADRCVFRLKKVSIVNGAQTAGSITTASLAGEISADAKLLVTIVEIGPGGDEFGIRITRARNHQSEVRGVYFAALDPNQERLRQELAVVGIKYHYRPSAEARVRRDDAFTLEEAAVALACLSFRVAHSNARPRGGQNAIDFAVTAKKEIGRLWEQDGATYGHLFAATLSGLRVFRLVRIYRLVDRILASNERAETAYYRRMFFRHARYFIMSLLAHRIPDVIDRPELAMSAADEALISRETNSLAELIYAQSQPLQGIKGYRSIFQNLTDSQPLADAVLDRLSEQDAANRAARAVFARAAIPPEADLE
jgi:AIPR protein